MAFSNLTMASSNCFTSFNNTQRLTCCSKSRPCHLPLHAIAPSASQVCDQTIVRRSAGYRPSNWDYHFIDSLSNGYVGEASSRRIKELKGQVKIMLERANTALDQLEIIDCLQRLGVAYHFQPEIERALNSISKLMEPSPNSLYVTSLRFRLLRQQGYNANPDIFNSFKDEEGNFKACLCDDIKGLISLYEASYLLMEGEDILEEAQDFAKKNLQVHVNNQKQYNDDYRYLCILASHALELPLHWRMQRAETRWFIDAYQSSPCFNPVVLELAKLDFNMVQAAHQEDLKHATSWWKKMNLDEKLNFARSRPMEGFLWTVGGLFEPEFDYFRRMISRVVALETVIDDIYDVYGTLEELHLFTDAIVRWDINAMDGLPHYMKICFLALYNSMNEMAFDLLKDQGVDITAWLKKGWADLSKSYLLEAKWYHSGYRPTLEEYLDNAWISVGVPTLLLNAYFTATNQITTEASECLKEYPDIVRYSSLIARLADDLATSSDEMERGDTPKAIQCYMHETGGSEEEAREHIGRLISEAWKKMNECQIKNSIFSQTYMKMTMNIARLSQCIYQNGDGFGAQTLETENHVLSLLVQPILISAKQ